MQTEAGGKKHNRFFGNLYHRLRGAKARRNETQRLATEEMEAIARELNLSRAELGTLAFKPPGSLWSLERRLSHAGLSEEALAGSHGDVLRDLRRVCSRCPSKARCARDLKHERRATPAKYCPNEQTLRALADEARPIRAQILPFPAARN
jgi:Family of unknown function (DUF6455)